VRCRAAASITRERGRGGEWLGPVVALCGALYYRLLISGERLAPRYADVLIDHFDPALTPPVG
jgi:hypothetical protein